MTASNKEKDLIIATHYISMSRYDEADEIIKTWIDHVDAIKEDWQLWIDSSFGKAKQTGYIHNWQESKIRCENGLEKFPDHWPFAATLLHTYFYLGEVATALNICDDWFKKTGEVDFLIHKIDIHRMNFDYDEAARHFHRFCNNYPEDDKYTFIKARFFYYVMDDKEKAYGLLSRYATIERNGIWFFITVLLETGRITQAIQLIDDFHFPLSQTLKEIFLRSWSLHKQKKYRTAKQLWTSYNANREDSRPSLHAKIHTLKQIDNHEISFAPDDIILFTVFKNEYERLPWFLKYYRDLGVSKFVFIDNGSSDKSADYILSQPDSHLFWTDDNFGAASSGMRWINELVSRHIQSQWFLYVDIDELLVFPGSETRKLSELTSYMEAYGYEVLPAFMLDLVPDNFDSSTPYTLGQDPLSVSKYFVNNFTFMESIQPPHRKVLGGIREVLFNEKHVQLDKAPLIKGGANIKFVSSHTVTSAVPSDITAVLLHFKFLGNGFLKFKKVQERESRRSECNIRHLNYANREGLVSQRLLLNKENLVEYKSSDQLVELNLATKPKVFGDVRFTRTGITGHWCEAFKAYSHGFFKAGNWHITKAIKQILRLLVFRME